MVKSKLTVDVLMDLGNSETRYYCIPMNKGEEYSDKDRFELCMQSVLQTCSNTFATLTPSYVVPEEYINEDTVVFEDEEGVRWANGNIVSMEFDKQKTKPSALRNKVDNDTTFLTIRVVLAKIISDLAKKYDMKPEKLDAVFNISVLLPPFEYDVAKEAMIEKVQSIKALKVCLPKEYETKINIGKVSVYAEGTTAFMASMFTIFKDEAGSVVTDANGEEIVTEEDTYYLDVRGDCEAYASGDAMLIDIGAGTTDMMLFRDTKLIQGSKETIKRGGNNVAAKFQQNIMKEYGIKVDVAPLLADCILKEGSEVEYHVEKCLDNAKQVFAEELKQSLITYLEGNSVEPRLLKCLILTGGGSLATERDGEVVSVALGDMLAKLFEEVAPKCKVVTTSNARNKNILGLKLLYMLAEGIVA